MDSVIRAVVVYLFLFVILRLNGKRSLGQINTFDFVLLLIISEASQQGMIGSDNSVTNSALCIVTLVSLDIGLGLIKQRSRRFEKLAEGVPMILVDHGEVVRENLDSVQVDEDDVLEAARGSRGLERMEQIKYAVLERTGEISIIPVDELRLRS